LNANEIYELGIAHTVGKMTIIIYQKKDHAMFPFDLAHIRRIEYEDRTAGRNLLKKTLIESLENLIKQKLKTIEDTRQDGSLLRINRLGLYTAFILVVHKVLFRIIYLHFGYHTF
jgi:hypothetical protein